MTPGVAFLTDATRAADDGRCIDWPWGTDSAGYARLWYDGGPKRASRVVLEVAGHPVPPAPGNHALHSCDRPICVAPWHLRWGTDADNRADKIARGRQSRVKVLGTRNGRARLTPEAVTSIRARHAAGTSLRELARQHDVHRSVVGDLIQRKTWSHIA